MNEGAVEDLRRVSTDPAILGRILQGERAAMVALVELLRTEQELLLKGDTDPLSALGEAKARHLTELTRHAEQRRCFLLDCKLTPDRDGMNAWLEAHAAAHPELRDASRQLLALTRTAHVMNRVNGTLIATRLRVTQQALNTLFGEAATSGAYGADGSTVTPQTRKLAVV